MTNEKVTKTRTPRQYDSILAGALKLPLQERVALVKTVTEANQTEVAKLKADSDAATKLLNGQG